MSSLALASFRLLSLFSFFSTAAFASDWPAPTSSNKPWTRWWWHGSAVEKTEITQELESFEQMGFGGVEITPIYGVEGQEEREKAFLSQEWFEVVRHACEEAKRLGLKVDIVPGTGWRLGHENVPEHQRAIEAKGILPYDKNSPNSFEVSLSGERVKRPAPGGSGYTIDMLNRDAVNAYLTQFNETFFKKIAPERVRAVFHDSWEYETNWSHKITEETLDGQTIAWEKRGALFQKNHSHLPAEQIERWRYDYRVILEQMLLNNFSDTWNQQTHSLGLLTRNQAHGSIANLLDVYAKTDIPETEIFRDSENFLVHKFASSAAHITGKNLVSAESYTWLGEHWTVDLAKLKRATDYLFLCGVNHIFFHGTAYSPADATWPGWVFYASTQLNDRNPLWNHLPALNAYITRSQSLLQSGSPYSDVYLYSPIADAYSEASGTKLRQNIDGKIWFLDSQLESTAQTLWDSGVHFDYISDRQLQKLAYSSATPPTIVLPKLKRIPIKTVRALDTLSKNGIKIISLSHPDNWTIPGTIDTDSRQSELDAIVKSATEEGRIILGTIENAIIAGTDTWQSTTTFRCLRRIHGDGSTTYFIVNRSDKENTFCVPIDSDIPFSRRLDPWTGQSGIVSLSDDRDIKLTLQPYESTFIQTFTKPQRGTPFAKVKVQTTPREIESPWTLRFLSGGPKRPSPIKLTDLLPINQVDSQKLDAFAGLLSYENTFVLSDEEARSDIQLDLGALSSSAEVFINQKSVGTLIRSPYTLSIPASLTLKGKNQINIEIATLADNRIRYMDRNAEKWRIFNDINFVNIDYKAFDASDWKISEYGLFGPVTLSIQK